MLGDDNSPAILLWFDLQLSVRARPVMANEKDTAFATRPVFSFLHLLSQGSRMRSNLTLLHGDDGTWPGLRSRLESGE